MRYRTERMAAFPVYLPEADCRLTTLSGHQARLSDSLEADNLQAGICSRDLGRSSKRPRSN